MFSSETRPFYLKGKQTRCDYWIGSPSSPARKGKVSAFTSNQLPGQEYELGELLEWLGGLWQEDGVVSRLAHSSWPMAVVGEDGLLGVAR